MKRAGVLCIAVLGVVVAASAVMAAGGSIPGEVHVASATAILGPPAPNRSYLFAGYVDSKGICLDNRKVEIKASYGEDPTLRPFDVARTGANGGFSGVGPAERDGQEITGAKLILKPKTVGPKHHRKTCAGTTAFP